MLAKRSYASAFAVEWSAVAALYLLDFVWARGIDFHLLLSWRNWMVIAGFLGGGLALRVLFPRRVGPFAEYFCLSLSGSVGLVIFSYLCMASAYHPLVDQALLRADLALGFDWLSLHNWVMAHPSLALAGSILYGSQVLQGFYCTIFLGLLWERTRMQELWRLTFIASILCCLTGMLFPALGPFKIFNLRAEGSFLPIMEHLLSHRDLVFTPASLAGVICFPSLHTAMALAIPYGLRRTGAIFWIFFGLNALLLFTIPFFGGHFLVDMIAGAVVMLVSLALARLWLAGPPAVLRDPQLVEKPA
ncbi:MAG TPA: phosphatase PAP2 family protein [Rhizomicrobium sp.]|nr:phosphatase PAP2 family protein [Rhizomicrobium sp.]